MECSLIANNTSSLFIWKNIEYHDTLMAQVNR